MTWTEAESTNQIRQSAMLESDFWELVEIETVIFENLLDGDFWESFRRWFFTNWNGSQVEYSAPASGCSLEPVPSDLVTRLDITGNNNKKIGNESDDSDHNKLQ